MATGHDTSTSTSPFDFARAACRRGRARAAGIALAGLGALGTASLPAQASGAPQPWGQRLVQTQELPAEALAKFALFQDRKDTADADRSAGAPPQTQAWTGEEMALPRSGNPYTLVVWVSGVALADGDASARWMAGWSIHGASRVGAVPQVAARGVRAGQVVEMAGAAAPLSFKEDRTVPPVLEFAGVSNLRMDRVRLEVWSGMRSSNPVERLMPWMPLFTGAVFLGLMLWWRRR
ncbi:hypothetical protein [Acidovorax sp. BLS4]|uniref:hypothetical protein n=1 Tax=Acidovorax sp. BLS4 TaxID=3273430 RepID=UPI002942767A|nr:hypothetical protein [Paracidovorax avenae]WOI44682.1 hypothetical protein R1Z03_19455 [Paracidovorax avenae]